MDEKTTIVYDLPVRIFHWTFAGLFIFSFTIAEIVDDDSMLYIYHMLSGIIMVFIVVLRLIWGLFGTKYAKITSYKLNPKELFFYLSTLLSSKTKRYLGHNPASSYAALAMFGFTLGLAATGILMSKGLYKHQAEDLHELFANGFLMTAIAHITGMFIHHIKHRDGLIFSMINGKKQKIIGVEGISSSRPFVALFFVGLILTFVLYLNHQFDSKSGSLQLFGTSVQLREQDDDNDDHKNNEDNDEMDND